MNPRRTNEETSQLIPSIVSALLLAAIAFLLGAARTQAQCTQILSGLREPIGSGLTDQGNLLISESGTGEAHTGRLLIVDPDGNLRTLLDGLPSAPADVGDPSGPTGFVMRGRILYLLIGTGDVGIMGPRPGTTLENPNGPSSPIFSSILAIHISPFVERNTMGFTLAPEEEQALADGQVVTLSNGGPDKITIQVVVDFPNFIPFPLPDVPDNIQVSKPLRSGTHWKHALCDRWRTEPRLAGQSQDPRLLAARRSVGRAPALQAGSQGFESPCLHSRRP